MTQDRNEAETRAELIDPALAAAGWGIVEGSRIRREHITLGRLIGGGKRGQKDTADYVLVYKNQKLAVIEAKKESLPVTEGLGQAKRYADRLQARFAYSTNGHGIYRVDMETGKEGDVDSYLSPQELWDEVFDEKDDSLSHWRERFSEVPFEDKGGSWQTRFYQHNAITNTLDAISEGKDRILLTLATGTGKTCIAFQLAWKLFHARWNLKNWKDEEGPNRRPRILFLADRNILADQAFNDFSAFPEDALVRIDPKSIAKKKRVPKNGSIFFTIFQTFMSGKDGEGNPSPNFGDYPSDFFDFIVIDECHRGGANDESTWRGILEYFSPAVQLGLTATPKRQGNIDTYDYFGEPVYKYSLKEGINDGYLTPFKVKQIATTLDEYVYTSDDDVIEGEIEEGRRYTESDFNRLIEIKEREDHRVKLFMDMIDQSQKTLVFCATQVHALAVRDLINQYKKSTDPNYCVRVTADDGSEGERLLRVFQDNEKTIPTTLTTSRKLSTGVDARNIRNIVLMRPIKSMIEFKQIVGRGTRLFEGKDFFTIYDFVKAYEHFNDPEWDGEPLDPVVCERCKKDPCICKYTSKEDCPICGMKPCTCSTVEDVICPECSEEPCVCKKRQITKIKLADGKERTIQHMVASSYWSPEGKPISAVEFIERLFGELPALFKSEEELRKLWSKPDTRKKLLTTLEEIGYGEEQLKSVQKLIDAEKSDIFDVLSYIAYTREPITREERVENHRSQIFKNCSDKQEEFISFVLDHYISQGVSELDDEKLPVLLELKYESVSDAVKKLGDVESIRDLFITFQGKLYKDAA